MTVFLIGAVVVMVTLAGLVIGAAIANERKRDGLASLLLLAASVEFASALAYLAQMGEAGAR
ncbi:hypothetical protein Q0Z83_060530 [Actinoplanes sichuanensis]|uniref:NADH-quinone oxidoreductase subunit K n=1 Tax=Actinoplanes sichuanensis TaxID=512349 RepID=A0ABW4A7D2_9ACTN|nr:hypothetical protein [Actinoplanes sichuanensis]BEL07862.1 hypothetical protein Q0Z83_060530 [Actinoplanes sichuanensis]